MFATAGGRKSQAQYHAGRNRAKWPIGHRHSHKRPVTSSVSSCALTLKTLGAQQSAIDSDVGAFDRNRADGLGVIVGRAYAADDAVTVAGVLHVLETGEQHRGADAAFSPLRIPARPSETLS